MRARKSLPFIASLALAATPFLASPAMGATATGMSAKADCWAEDPGQADGSSLSVRNKYETGWATFYEKGERLQVVDHESDGRRVVAKFEICYDGAWRHYGWYDSGPNDGPLDSEDYNLAFKDGRYLRMQACERTPNGEHAGCGRTQLLIA